MLPETLHSHEDAASLQEALPLAITAGKFERGELTLEILPAEIQAVLRHFKGKGKYERLSGLTGVDRYPAEPRFEVVYHLHSLARNTRLRLKARLPGVGPEIDSVTPVYLAANWYERETFDLFGIHFRNHPDLRRIMMPEDWEGHPLRKDYPKTGQRV